MAGLTSLEAQKRLYAQLSILINSRISIRWLQETKKNPCSMVVYSMMVIAGLLLVIEFSLIPERRDSWSILLQALVLFFLAAFNLCLQGWEVYMLRTQKVRQLLGRLGGGAFESSYPWTPSDYPNSVISTLRGPLTAAAYRDGSLVNVPISLLVHGDIIELEAGVPSPANAELLEDEDKGAGAPVSISAGEVLPQRLFGTKDGKDDGYYFLPEVKSVKLVVKEAPILIHLDSAMQKKDSPTLLTREVKLITCIATALLVVFYVMALFFNLLRYFLLKQDFDNSWQEMFFGIPVFTSLPLLLPNFPLVWSLINLYGTARITLLVERGPLYFSQISRRKRLKAFVQTLVVMAQLICWGSHNLDIRTFHILGRLTSVCAVDKEYLLTGGFPSPEKVFFFRTEDIPPEEAAARAEEDGNGVKLSENERTREHTLGGIQVSVTSPSSNQLEPSDKGKDNMMDGSCQDRLQVVAATTAPMHGDSASAASVLSDTTPFDLVMEILDISPDPSSYSGLAFDDVDWQSYINSLKPIGVNLLATSHLRSPAFSFLPLSSCGELRHHLHKSCCSCPLSVEIGVTEFFRNKFKVQFLLTGISSCLNQEEKRPITRKATPTFMSSSSSYLLPPHIISTVISSEESGKTLLMSRGSGNMIAHCCSDFWDGRDLQPLTEMEKQSIVSYYDSRSLSSYCVALAFNPMVNFKPSRIPKSEVGIYVPSSNLADTLQSDQSTSSMLEDAPAQGLSSEQLFRTLQCNQVFLGLVSLQYRPKQDIVSLIEDLYTAGIRFVHFTAENEVRAKIFAQKLGLEVDWNCFISLAQSSTVSAEIETNEDGNCDEEDGNDNSMASSVLSIYQATMSHIRAKLPTGIENIRPHIENVDNVPLLVSLFTECSSDTIMEMLQIMQENSEVILCLGNAWNQDNMAIFSQADVGVSLIPQHVDFTTCMVTETCALSNSNSSQNNSQVTSGSRPFPSPLEVASYINSAPCQLCLDRDDEVSLLSLVYESRRLLTLVRLSLVYGLGTSLCLSVLMLLSSVFFLPPPLNGNHLFWMLMVTIPLGMLSFLAMPLDPKVKSQMPTKRKSAVPDLWPVVLEFALFGVTGFYCLVIFAVTLAEICTRNIASSSCHFLLGNRNSSHSSEWNGWRGSDSGQGLLFAQDLVAFFVTVYFVFLSIRYVHRTRPLWKLRGFVTWQYLCSVILVVFLQLVYFIVSQSIAGSQMKVIACLSSVPVSAWFLGLVWPAVILVFMEIFKYIDKRKFKNAQTLLFLQFGTKLGMHSPI